MPPTPLLSTHARSTSSSAIRDLLDQARRPGMISLAGGLPDAELFPLPQLADIAAAQVRAHGRTTLQYGTTQGEPRLRDGLAAEFGCADSDSIVVTTGSQQGLALVADVLLDIGDTVVCGDPDYLGFVQIAQSRRATVHPIPIDEHGLDVDRLALDIDGGLRPKLCYVVPHFHNPTGSCLSAPRRRELHRLADRHGFVVIEDDPYRELWFASAPDPSPPDAELVIRMRSTSKVLAPGLRVGAMHVPSALVGPIVRAKQVADLHTSTLCQAIAADALAAPWFEPHVAALRRSYAAKRDRLVDLLADAFGDRLDVARPDGGMFLWATHTDGIDTDAWLQRALGAGVCFVPGSAFSVVRDLRSSLRLSFATASETDLARAVDRLVASCPDGAT